MRHRNPGIHTGTCFGGYFQDTHTPTNAQKLDERRVGEAVEPGEPLLFAGCRPVDVGARLTHVQPSSRSSGAH